MTKIFHSIFYSFFRTIGRIFAYLSIGFLLAIVCSKLGINFGFIQVNASTIPGWASNLPSLSRVDFYDCNSNGCTTAINTANEGLSTDYGNRDMIVTTSQVSIAQNGVKIAYPFIQKKGYLYQSIFYVCSSTNINNSTFEIYSSVAGNTKNHNNIFNDTAYATMNNVPGDGSQSFNSCRQIIGIVVPENDNLWFNVKMTSKTTIKSYIQVVGVETKELGLYTDTIRQIVENSNGNVVEAVDKVTEETKKTNDTLNDTNITESDTELNSFFSNFDDGDTGSLMNLISLPLSYLENLKGSCKNVNLPLPYFGNVQLQCMSTSVYNQNNDLKPIFVLVKLLINGIICYKCLKGLIYFIKDLKEPEKDNLEVLDL